MHSGQAVIGYQKLKEYNLFKYLFPFTEKILHKHKFYDEFFNASLRNTDIRINKGMHVNPSFIYAVFLWPYFQEILENNSQKKQSLEIDEIFRLVIESQAKYIAIPDFFQSTIFTIWSLQSSFLNLSKRNVEYLTGLNKFRAAYDFFYIRPLMDPDLKNYADKWYDIQKNVKSKKRYGRSKNK
jgi:poly(A) polymerase